jgi:formylglycine-generating enzyme required for sulfatase activity
VLPVYVSLPRLASERRHPFDMAEEDLRTREGDLQAAGLAKLLRAESKRAGAGRVWLFLDGLDEVTGAQREWLNATLERYAETLPQVAMAVFSRPVGYICPGAAFQKDEAKIQLLDPTKQQELLAKWLAPDTALADKTYQRLQTRPGLREACRVPLLLSLLALLAQRMPSLPANRVDLYSKAIDTLLERGHGDTPKGVHDPHAARVVLRELAAHLQQTDSVAWSRDRLGEALLELQDSNHKVKLRIGAGKIWHDGAEYLKELRDISGVLADHDGDSAPWRFLHRQFKELLVAEALREGGDAAVIAQAQELGKADIPRWAEALGFGCELADDPLAVLQKLAEVSQDLALRVLPEVEGVDHVEALGLLLAARSEEGSDENQDDDEAAESAKPGEWDGYFLAQLLDRWIEQGGLDPSDAQDWLWRQVQPGRSILELAYLHFALAHLDPDVDRERFFQACKRWPESGTPAEPNWVSIPKGTFTMGSPEDEPERFSDEHQHEVQLDEFELAATAITNEAYAAFDSEHEPEHFGGRIPSEEVAQHPVVNLCWWEAYLYSQWVGGTLPTEAQWEYACRAGTTTPFSSGENISPDVVNYDGNHPYRGGSKGEYREGTVAVASLPSNAWALYEMHGNVFEWCRDVWSGGEAIPAEGDGLRSSESPSYRVIRGGSWRSPARYARSASRPLARPAHRDDFLGFRPARHHS